MLDLMRRKASGWIVKGLFLILAASFVLWGVPTEFAGFGRNSLATVGPATISTKDYERALRRQLTNFRDQTGEALTLEQARVFGVTDSVLNQLVGQAAILNHAQTLRLSLSDAAVAEGVRRDPRFKGPSDTFSRQQFDSILAQNDLSEQAFLAGRREDELRGQLIDSVMKGVAPPMPLIGMLHAYQDEERVIAHLTIDGEKAVTVPEPDDVKLKETWEANKREFMTPEYRKLAILVLAPEELRDRVPVTDEEVKTAYEETKETYDTLEKRRVQQIAFKDAKVAAEAKAAIDKGKAFTEVAKETGAALTDIDLGLVTKKALIDPKIADAAFGLEKDKVSGVVEGRFATVLLRVTEIEPGVARTFEDVKSTVRDRLFAERAKGEIQKLYDEVEDARGAGKPLEEIASEKKLKFVAIEATSKSNLTPDGKTASELGDAGLVEAGFAAQIGVEAEPKELKGGGYAWVDVLGITEPAQRPFEEVKTEVRNLHMERERQRALTELGAKLGERLKSGETLETLAKEFGGKPAETAPFKRKTEVEGVSPAVITQAFALPANGAGFATSADGKSRTVFRVKEIKPAGEPSPANADALAGELRKQMENDAVAAYVEALKARQGVDINQDALRQATGVETQQ